MCESDTDFKLVLRNLLSLSMINTVAGSGKDTEYGTGAEEIAIEKFSSPSTKGSSTTIIKSVQATETACKILKTRIWSIM